MPIMELPVKPGDMEKFVAVAAGNNHLIAMTTQGNVYTWGAGEQGQLGRKVIERRKIHGTVNTKTVKEQARGGQVTSLTRNYIPMVSEYGFDSYLDMNLPQELTDKIIDEVWDADDHVSHAATKTASLISRAWVDRSQSHLFHTIKFYTTDRQLGRWCNAVNPGPSGVSRHVRSLTIHARSSDGWFINEDFFERALPHFDSFRNIRALRVLNWNVTLFPLEVFARCFTPFAEGIRLLQWEPHFTMTHEVWSRVVGMFPRVDHLLFFPNHFRRFQLPPTTPVGVHRKKLIFCGNRAANYITGCNLQFQEIYMRCNYFTTLKTVIEVINDHADRLEVLTILGVNKVTGVMSNAGALTSALGRYHALRELSLDWVPVDDAREPYFVDAIPGDCIQLLRIMPSQDLWDHMWDDDLPASAPLWLGAAHEKLAQTIRQLGIRFSAKNRGRKISVRFVIPRVPYVMCDPMKYSVIAFWEVVEDTVSLEFEMTEAELQNLDKRRLIYNLEP